MNDRPDIFQRIVDAANAASLDFILIGGHAVNARGYARTTLDFDFLIAAANLTTWETLLGQLGYAAIHKVEAFVQFEPETGDGFRIDLMMVDDSTLRNWLLEARCLPMAIGEFASAGVLHLIALKLHAIRGLRRAMQGKDYYDILNLIRIHRIDTHSSEFEEILQRYASPTIKEPLLHDLERDL